MAIGPGASNAGGDAGGVGSDPQMLDPSRSYPHPFFSISDKYIPNTMKEMFRWAMYVYSTNGNFAQVIRKMSSYATTELVYNTKDQKGLTQWKEMFERTLKYQRVERQLLLDFFTYGNAFVRFLYPKQRMLACPKCKKSQPIANVDYSFNNFRFQGKCPGCAYIGALDVYDRPIKNRSRLKLIRIDPRYIQPLHEPVSGETEFLYSVPRALANRIREGSNKRAHIRVILENVPLEVITAVEKNYLIRFPNDAIFHLKWDSISRDDNSMGEIPFLAVFKMIWLYATLLRGQEAISLEHILPWLMVSPATTSGGTDPISNFSMEGWMSFIRDALPRWRRDPNFVAVAPFPVNAVQLRGDAKSLDNWQGMQHVRETISGGMGFPESLLFGGTNYSGGSVELRILENDFKNIGSILDQLLGEFIMPKIIRYFSYPKIEIHHQPFKMADDVAQRQMFMALHQTGVLSEQKLGSEFGINFEEERERIKNEMEIRTELQRQMQLQDAETQAAIRLIMARAEYDAQQIMMTGQDPKATKDETEKTPFGNQGQKFQSSPEVIKMQAQSFMRTTPATAREGVLAQISISNPSYAAAIRKEMASLERQMAPQQAPPAPAQKPPRRSALNAR